MTTKALRKKAHELIDKTDDDFMQVIYKLLYDHAMQLPPPLSEKEYHAMLDKRRAELRSGKTKTYDDRQIISELKQRSKKKKKK